MLDLKYKLTHSDAKKPIWGSDDAACFDVYATNRTAKGPRAMIYGTGVKFQIPKGYHIEAVGRSSHGFRDELRLANSVGIIDQDYTGELFVKLVFDGVGVPDWPFVGDRIVQCQLKKTLKYNLVEVDEIEETKRGEKGLGSSGK